MKIFSNSKIVFVFAALIILFGFFAVKVFVFKQKTQNISLQTNAENLSTKDSQIVSNAQNAVGSKQGNPDFQAPLDNAKERVTKKPFGIYITPKTSPVQPERFQGYHTGTDFETFPQEADIDVAVRAVCNGKLLLKENASGYGGVAVESCKLDGKPITVVYGHIKLESVTNVVGDNLSVGENFAILGKGYSSETDGERKHLHLGFHHGSSINILGYVETQTALPDWIDPCQYVCGN